MMFDNTGDDIAPQIPSILSEQMRDFVHLPTVYDLAIATNERTNLALSDPHSTFGQDAIVLMYGSKML